MGIGSFFASLFHKEIDRPGESSGPGSEKSSDGRSEGMPRGDSLDDPNDHPRSGSKENVGVGPGSGPMEKGQGGPGSGSGEIRKGGPGSGSGEIRKDRKGSSPEENQEGGPGLSPEENPNGRSGKGQGRKNKDRRSSKGEADQKPAAAGPNEEEVQAKKEYLQGKKDLYQYLNRIMKQLYEADLQAGWEDLAPLEGPPETVRGVLDRVRMDLPDHLQVKLDPFMNEDLTAAPAGLREAFYQMLLPFYPVYSSELSEFRYQTLLNREALDLFRRLTGRKFRLGYRNRYDSGVTAFEWDKNRYKVYDKNGTLLCDAVFEDGRIKEGFALADLQEEAGSDPDWRILKKGYYKGGVFTETSVVYRYTRPIC